MTFYNPNVQSYFEATQPDYPALKGLTLATIDFIFDTPGIDGRQYSVSLNDRLLQNYLGNELSDLLAEVVYRTWQGSILTPADFILRTKDTHQNTSTDNDYYLTHLIKLLVERLFLNPICPLCRGKLNLHELIYPTPTDSKEQSRFSLFEKLTITDFLINNLHFRPDGKQMHSQQQKHFIKVIVCTI